MRVLIAGLSPEKQELLALRFAAGLSSREIAPLVGRSHPAVQKELVRIMQSLKEQVRDTAI
jgi:RNA polymerase sigma-70 factor (ECF subfamily)